MERQLSRERGVCAECHNRRAFPAEWAEYDRLQQWRTQHPTRTPNWAARIEQMLNLLPSCVYCGTGCVVPSVQRDRYGRPAHLTCQPRPDEAS